MKLQYKCIFLALLLAAVSAGCTPSAPNTQGVSSGVQSAASAQATDAADSSWDEASAIKIDLTGSGAACTSGNVAVDGSTVRIAAAGTYVLSGTLENGQILVDAGKEDTVRLILNGVDITCNDSAPIYAKKAGMTIVTLAEGTSNSLTDGAAYQFADGEDEPDAALFCKDSLTINGSGSLTVTGNYKNGIGAKDDLVVSDGVISIKAANDGLRGRDSITVTGGTFTIEAGGDGVQSNNDTDADKGWIMLGGGVWDITSGNDGIQAETELRIDGGEYAIVSGNGSANADAVDAAESYKGLKSGTNMSITGGSFTLDTADDTIHSNGDAEIAGGTFALSAGDDGVHADGKLIINGGTIDIKTSYEGLEGTSVDINGGDIRLMAKDDGINAAGGSDGEAAGRMRPDSFSGGDKSSYYIRVTGGTVLVDAGGDGLDSNGNLYIDGGTVLVNGPENNGNGALDYDGSCVVSGGVLAAAGSSGMAQTSGSDSTQPSLAVYYTAAQEAGTLAALTDSQGNVVAAFAPAKKYQSIVFSSPDLKQGETYTLYTGGSCDGDEASGFYSSGTLTGAEKQTDVTLSDSDMVTSIAEDGSEAVQRGMGGHGGMGGGRRGGMSGQRPDMGGTPPDGMQPPEGGGHPEGAPPEGIPEGELQ